jgi:Fe-S oxidoreductase/nitrate reductase gamma subunit
MSAGREIFWNIGLWGNMVYVLMAIAIGLFVWAFYHRYLLWRTGRPENRLDHLSHRITSFVRKLVVEVLGQRRILREPFPGVMHLIIFWAFLCFLLATIADFTNHYVFHFLEGRVYLWFSLIVDSLGLLALLAILGFAARRYIQRPALLDNRPFDALALTLLFLLILTGFLVEGSRLAATEMIETPQYAVWSIGGWICGRLFLRWGPSVNRTLHLVWWNLHLGLVIVSFIYVALSFSKLMHILVAPLNIFFRSLRPTAQLLPIDFETATAYGAGQIQEFTWKQLLDLDACTRCGRCQDSCPAHLSGKVLSPKKVTQDLKTHMEEGWSPFFKAKTRASEESESSDQVWVGDVVSQEALWDCTTCGACMEACPVYVEHMEKFIEMRRNQVLAERGIPQTVQETLRNMEIRGHPWRGAESLRDDWTQGMGIKVLSQNSHFDWLYFVGCTGALVERNMLVTKAFARLLQHAHLDFGILGNEEGCCGDPARRMGHELQFQLMAQQNIKVFKNYGVKKIVTHCPHCYNTLKHEYPQFGGEFQVWHHSELLNHLIRDGSLSLGGGVRRVITYHDPCYLGRHNNMFDTPRNLLKSIPGLEIVEMERSGARSFCCGGGGGHAWMEEPVGRRINRMRLEEAMKTGAELIGLACPFCLQMMEDAITSLDSSMKAMDLSELIACNTES